MNRERALLQRLVDSGVLGGYSFIAEVKELLAQPELSTDSLQLDEQEPVAWMNDSGGCFLSDGNKYSENWTALYASPPKPERMTDDEISAVTAGHDPTPYGVHMFKMGIRWYEKYKSRVGVYDDSE